MSDIKRLLQNAILVPIGMDGLNRLCNGQRSKVLRYKGTVRTLEAQSRVALRASIDTYDTSRILILRNNVDSVGLKAAA